MPGYPPAAGAGTTTTTATTTRRAGLQLLLAGLAMVGLPGLGGLAGCAARPRNGDLLSGRLALKVEGRSDRNVTANFELSGNARQGALVLTTPLGTTAAQARWSPAGAWLARDGGEQRFDTLDDLADEAVGEPLPLAALFDWLRGRPWPDHPSTPNLDGEPGFSQLGWRVSLTRWAEGWVEARRELPAPALTVRVRLDRPDTP